MQVAIIGSGVAGLTAGAYLARQGHQVTVFEQYHRAGGVTAPYQRQGYTWDLGQLLIEGLGPDEPLGQILARLDLTDQVPIEIEDRGYVFPDFSLSKPDVYQGFQWRINRLKKVFPEEAGGLDRYWADYKRFVSVMTFARRLDSASGARALFWRLRLLLKALPLMSKQDWSAQQLMDDYFQSQKLKLVFTSILADFFTAPSDFVGLGVFALNPEISFDKRMPRELDRNAVQVPLYNVLGGISTLVNALVVSIESHGGEVLTSRPITGIVVENGRTTGVVDGDGEMISADAVIASGGAKKTFLDLVGEEHLPPQFVENVRNIPLMDSVFMLHLGVDFDPSPHVHGVCTYYYGTYDLDRALEDGAGGVYHEGRDGFVVHIPSLHSPQMAPAGHHAMTIYTICPDTLKDGNWETLKEDYADKLIACAEAYIPGLSDHIQICEILTPREWRSRTHLEHHAFGGIKPVLGAWRVPFQSPIEGLWFIGAQSESGGGVFGVMPAAFKTAKQIDAIAKGTA